MLRLFLIAVTCALVESRWYDGIQGVKVFKPTDDDIQNVTDTIYWWRNQREAQFNQSRYALLFTRGTYNESLHIMAGYYTSIIGVGRDPSEVRVPAVMSVNGKVGGATQNFWRSVEGVTLTAKSIVWAVSQAAPIRRTVVEGDLYLSDNGGWSSGGFLADVKVKGRVGLGTQQQWFFRNVDVSSAGMDCPIGWNYVFLGVEGVDSTACKGDLPGKVTVVDKTPRIAEKPYVVQEDDEAGTWRIYVPWLVDGGTRGATQDYAAAVARKLDIEEEVFVAQPSDSVEKINEGIRGKRGLLLTPGVYKMDKSIVIDQDGFVVLGLGFPTLVATGGEPAILVDGKAEDVRVAGLLVEAGTPKSSGHHPLALLMVGQRGKSGKSPPGRAPTVLSDVFARVGAFQYLECQEVSTQNMLEINTDDVVIDNAWLWHADHDNCGRKSDDCHSEHALVVSGDRVRAYGLAAEHTVGGDIVQWYGEGGETYFYQCELPYHTPAFGPAGYAGYAVAPSVKDHVAYGLGVYIIGTNMQAQSAYLGSPTTEFHNLNTVVIGGNQNQFKHLECALGAGDGANDLVCDKPDHCDDMRCVVLAKAPASPKEPPVPPPNHLRDSHDDSVPPEASEFDLSSCEPFCQEDTSTASTTEAMEATRNHPGGARPPAKVTETGATWQAYTHYDLPDAADAEELVGQNISVVMHEVEKQGYAGFSLQGKKAFLKKARTQLTEDDLRWMGGTSNVSFYIYTPNGKASAAHETSPSTSGESAALPALVPGALVPELTGKEAKEAKAKNKHTISLKITIVSAAGLESQDWLGGRSDPYCSCQVPGKHSTFFKTETQLNNPSPTWNHDAVISEYEKGDSLQFDVLDKDFWDDNLLGSAVLKGEQIYPGAGFIGALPLVFKGGPTAATLNVKVEVLRSGPNSEPLIALMSKDDASRHVRTMASRILLGISHLGVSRSLMLAGIVVVSVALAAGMMRVWSPRTHRRPHTVHPLYEQLSRPSPTSRTVGTRVPLGFDEEADAH